MGSKVKELTGYDLDFEIVIPKLDLKIDLGI